MTLLALLELWVPMMLWKSDCGFSCPSTTSRPLKNQWRLCSLGTRGHRHRGTDMAGASVGDTGVTITEVASVGDMGTRSSRWHQWRTRGCGHGGDINGGHRLGRWHQ